MAVRVRCANCATEQQAPTDREVACQICGATLVIPDELLGPESSASQSRADGHTAAAQTADVYEVTTDGSLAAHAASLPEAAPLARIRELEEIRAQTRRSTWLLALVPLWGLWRIYRSDAHSPGQKLRLSAISIAVTAALAFGVNASLPSSAERAQEAQRRVRDQIEALRDLVEKHRAERGRYPDAEGWTASAKLGDLRFYDPWGRIYQYEPKDPGYRIGTLGRDGAKGGEAADEDLFLSFGGVGAVGQSRTGTARHHVILGPGGCPAVEVFAPASVELRGTLEVNANCRAPASAIRIEAGGQLQVEKAIRVAGEIDVVSSAISPRPESSITPFPDPLATILPPEFNGITFTTPQERRGLPMQNASAEHPRTLLIDDQRTLSPGVYWGGIRLVDGAQVTLQPGEYVLAGGGFVVEGGGRVQGRGVLLYNTLDPVNPAGIGGYEPFRFRDAASVALTAPDTGSYRGVVLFQDRANARGIEIEGDAVDLAGFDGAIYAPAAELRFHSPVKKLAADLVVGRLTMQSSLIVIAPTQNPSSG